MICCSEGQFGRRLRIHIREAEKVLGDSIERRKDDAEAVRTNTEAKEANAEDAEVQEADAEETKVAQSLVKLMLG